MAELGHDVVGVDIDTHKVDLLAVRRSSSLNWKNYWLATWTPDV